MNKLLYICNPNSFSLESIEGTLSNLENSVDEIVLHYSYQIPKNTSNIIEAHDNIKKDASDKLLEYSNLTQNKLGVKTSYNVTLGTEQNTLKRLLDEKKYNYILSPKNFKDIAEIYKNVNFIVSK